MKSTTNTLIGFFVQISYFIVKEDENYGRFSSNSIKQKQNLRRKRK